MSTCQISELGLEKADDGEFYMNFSVDFLKYFGEVEIVHRNPGDMTTDSRNQYDVMYFIGAWRREANTAAGCGNDGIGKNRKQNYLEFCKLIFIRCKISENMLKNPQFPFLLTDPDTTDYQDMSNVIVSLTQRVEERHTEHILIHVPLLSCFPT